MGNIQISWFQARVMFDLLFADAEGQIRKAQEDSKSPSGRPLTEDEVWALNWAVKVEDEDNGWWKDSEWSKVLTNLDTALQG